MNGMKKRKEVEKGRKRDSVIVLHFSIAVSSSSPPQSPLSFSPFAALAAFSPSLFSSSRTTQSPRTSFPRSTHKIQSKQNASRIESRVRFFVDRRRSNLESCNSNKNPKNKKCRSTRTPSPSTSPTPTPSTSATSPTAPPRQSSPSTLGPSA